MLFRPQPSGRLGLSDGLGSSEVRSEAERLQYIALGVVYTVMDVTAVNRFDIGEHHHHQPPPTSPLHTRAHAHTHTHTHTPARTHAPENT